MLLLPLLSIFILPFKDYNNSHTSTFLIMQETGLNILAIAIFSITLSVLIGPVFGLSPYIPAGITFLLLGLVTADTLAWKNQGVNLLVNIFNSREQKDRVIYHEAGHFLTAYLYNIPIEGYTLTVWENIKNNSLGSGGVIFDTTVLLEKKEDLMEFNVMIERLSIVLMAGIAAEEFIYKNSEGGMEDINKLREICQNLGLATQEFNLKQRQAILQAKNLIETNKESYLALVEGMKQRKSVEECKSIIKSL